jgi:16S rRNA (guanine1516-N2)-methyltransferase
VADIKGIKTGDPELFQRAKKLSSKYNVLLLEPESSDTHINLDYPSVLCFQGMKLVNSFIKGKFYSRITKFQNESLLKKACAVNTAKPQKILDTTGGLGHDAFILALLGQKVTVVEKNAGLCILLEEALNELPDLPYFNDAVSNITIINSDSRKLLDSVRSFDVIYVDPMFNSKKRLKRTKQMEFLDLYLDDYDDPAIDFFKSDFKRLVIKKELRASASIKDSSAISFKGSSIRYDVYIREKNEF